MHQIKKQRYDKEGWNILLRKTQKSFQHLHCSEYQQQWNRNGLIRKGRIQLRRCSKGNLPPQWMGYTKEHS